MSYNQNAYHVSPQQLMLNQNNRGRGSQASHPQVDPATLTPSTVHLIPYRPLVSPQMIIDGYTPPHQVVAQYLILPRLPDHRGIPSIPSITFSSLGEPGPYIKDIMKYRITMDGAHDLVFTDFSWKRTLCCVDSHGIMSAPDRLHTTAPDGTPLTREMLARELCSMIFRFFSSNHGVIGVDWRRIRLLSFSYYRKLWVPVLAIDS